MPSCTHTHTQLGLAGLLVSPACCRPAQSGQLATGQNNVADTTGRQQPASDVLATSLRALKVYAQVQGGIPPFRNASQGNTHDARAFKTAAQLFSLSMQTACWWPSSMKRKQSCRCVCKGSRMTLPLLHCRSVVAPLDDDHQIAGPSKCHPTLAGVCIAAQLSSTTSNHEPLMFCGGYGNRHVMHG